MRISDWSSDGCSSDLQTAKQSIQTARQQSESVRATLSGHVDAPAEQQPEVQRAQAALDRALLNLGYTTVRAPQAGIVTKVNQLQVGDFVSASRPVFTLVGQRLWVEGNFKEKIGRASCRERVCQYV